MKQPEQDVSALVKRVFRPRVLSATSMPKQKPPSARDVVMTTLSEKTMNNHYKSSQIRLVPFVFLPLTVVLALCYLFSGCSSEATKRRAATYAYWAELSRICNKFIAASQGMDKVQTPESIIEKLEKANKLYRNLSDDIGQLPSSLVDADAVALGADYIQALNECAILSQDMIDLMKLDTQLQAAADSPSVAVESFIRGLMGDPLGKVNEFKSASQKLANDGDQLRARWATIQQRIATFDAREVKLRAALAEKYRRDFPPLTPPRIRD